MCQYLRLTVAELTCVLWFSCDITQNHTTVFKLHSDCLSSLINLVWTSDDEWRLSIQLYIVISASLKIAHATVASLPLIRSLSRWSWLLIRALVYRKQSIFGPTMEGFHTKGSPMPGDSDSSCVICLEGSSSASGSKTQPSGDLGPLEAFCSLAPTKHPAHRS